MKLSSILVVYTTPITEEQELTWKTVIKVLKKYKINYKLANRDRLKKSQFKNRDLVIAVGGDGTFLRAAQFTDDQLMFGVNADPKNKEGFFMKAEKRNFEGKLMGMMGGKSKIIGLPRLEASINNRKIDTFALNEFFVGPKKSYHAAKYIIKIGKKKERQKSSGVLITTPAGSHSWAKSSCGRSLSLNSKGFQFIVREPYQGKIFKNYKLIYGILRKNQTVEIISEMIDGVIVADSVSKEFSFKEGNKAKIRLSNRQIKVLWQ